MNENEKDQIYYINEEVYSKLKDHQKEALKWLLTQNSHERGSLLADEMGLGKTICAIALIITQYTTHFFHQSPSQLQNNQQSLIVCPKTIIFQWKSEIQKWNQISDNILNDIIILDSTLKIDGIKINNFKEKTKFFKKFSEKKNGIILTSYEQVRDNIDFLKKIKWHQIVLDEAQKIKNSETQIHQASLELQGQNKLILSGTPMENKLEDLWSLINFIQPGVLGSLQYFIQEYCNKIIKGSDKNADEIDKITAKKMINEVHNRLKNHILRRTKQKLESYCNIPKRNEYIVPCNMTKEQLKIYEAYLDDVEKFIKKKQIVYEFQENQKNSCIAYIVINNLRKICNHPYLFFNYHLKADAVFGQKNHSYSNLSQLKEFIKYKECNQDFIKKNNVIDLSVQDWEMSGKIKVLFSFLNDWCIQNQENESNPEYKPNQVLIFSQTKKSLDIIEQLALKQKYFYQRMDGSVSNQERQVLVNKFNSNRKIFVFLLTTKVGGLGLNLQAANKVIIFDPDWNPMVDLQASDRALRLKENIKDMHNVIIYRLLIDDSVEEKIYFRQIFKKFMADKILHNSASKKLFDQQSLHELFEKPQKKLKNAITQQQTFQDQNLKKNDNQNQILNKLQNSLCSQNSTDKDSNKDQNYQTKIYKVPQKEEEMKEHISNIQNFQIYNQKANNLLQELEKEQNENLKSLKNDIKSGLIANFLKIEDEKIEEPQNENQDSQDFNDLSTSQICQRFQQNKQAQKQADSYILKMKEKEEQICVKNQQLNLNNVQQKIEQIFEAYQMQWMNYNQILKILKQKYQEYSSIDEQKFAVALKNVAFNQNGQWALKD